MKPAEQTVDLLDRGVTTRHVDERLVVAVRPVVAAEPAPGEPDDAPGDDEQAQSDRGDERDLAEPADAQRPTLALIEIRAFSAQNGSTHAR